MNLDDSLYGPQRDIRQTAHAQEQKAVGILTKTLGCSRSQAALLVRQQQDRNAQARTPKNPNEGNKIGPLFQDLPQVKRGTPQVEVAKTQIVPVPQTPIAQPFLPGITEAPEDGLVYGRSNADWTVAVEEALVNGNSYIRKNAGWVTFTSASIPDVTSSGNYWRTLAGWVQDTVDEAPNDSTPYSRQSLGWVSSPGFPDTPIDATNYWRRDHTWVADPLDEAPIDGNKYARKDGLWTSFTTIPDAPFDGTIYGRFNGTWVDVSSVVSGFSGSGVYTTFQFVHGLCVAAS